MEQRRGALLVSEVIGGIHGRFHRREPVEVVHEVPLAPDLAALVRAHVVHHRVLADVQVPEVHVRLPRVLAHVMPHEFVEVVQPGRLRRGAAIRRRPEHKVLDDVQHSVPVRVRRRGGRDASQEPAVGLQHDEPGAVLVEPGEDVLPLALGDGAPDVVGLALDGEAQAAGPVQEHLLRRAGLGQGGEGQGRGLEIRHRPAVGARHVELRELAVQRLHQRAARAEVHGQEQGFLPLHFHPHGELVGECWPHLLPPGNDVDGALVKRLPDAEHGHRRRDLHELDLPREHDAEALAAAASDGPEVVLPHAGPVEELALGVDQRGVEDLVDGEAVLAHQHADASAAEVAAHAEGGALAGRERELGVALPDGVVELPDGGAGVDPGRGVGRVDADRAELVDVDHPEHLGPHRPVRQALVVVAAAAHAEAHAMPAAAEHGGLDVAGVCRRHDAERPHRGVGKEVGVPDGGDQHVGEVAVALLVDELARYLIA
ncbi:unnamed protein product [Alopecurus aequalis]